MSDALRLGLVQMYVEPGDKRANLARAKEMIARAASGGAQVVVLPEAMDCGWTHPSARTLASAVPGGDTFELLSGAARSHRVSVCSGLIRSGTSAMFERIRLTQNHPARRRSP